MSVCTKYCDACVYRKSFTSGAMPYCDYLCMVGKPRPCPAGDGCTVRSTRRVYRKRAMTEEEKAQREERKREAKRRSYQKHREEYLARQKQWQKEHREQLNAYSREYRKRRKEMGCYEKTDGC